MNKLRYDPICDWLRKNVPNIKKTLNLQSSNALYRIFRDSMNLFSFTIILYSTANANGSSNLNSLLSQRNIEIPFYTFRLSCMKPP